MCRWVVTAKKYNSRFSKPSFRKWNVVCATAVLQGETKILRLSWHVVQVSVHESENVRSASFLCLRPCYRLFVFQDADRWRCVGCSISKFSLVMNIKRGVITAFSVAHLFRWSFVTFQHNPRTHWCIRPVLARKNPLNVSYRLGNHT
jgi:hypothetical protein